MQALVNGRLEPARSLAGSIEQSACAGSPSRRGRQGRRRQTHASTLQAISANAAPTGQPPPRCPHMSASRAAPSPRNEQNALRASTAGCCACAMMRHGLAADPFRQMLHQGRGDLIQQGTTCAVCGDERRLHPCGCLSGEDSERRFLRRCRRNRLLGGRVTQSKLPLPSTEQASERADE